MEQVTQTASWVSRNKRTLHRSWIVIVLGLVGWQLSQIGWSGVWASVPTTPWFYIIFTASFFVLPISERAIFGIIWPAAPRATLSALMRKRALNNMVISYSGDLFFFLWARTRLHLPDRRVLAGIKDSSILSAIASGLLNAALVAVFFVSGSAGVIDRVLADHRSGMWAAIGVLVLLVPIFIRYHKRVLWIGAGQARRVFLIHCGRNILVLLLQLAQWKVVLPDVSTQTWLMFLTVQMLVSNLPLLPNRDFLFLAVGVGLVDYLGVQQAAIASMFVAMTFLKQAANLMTLLVTSITDKSYDAEDAAQSMSRSA